MGMKEYYRLVYGSVLEALDTELFGEDVARSDTSKLMLSKLAKLNLKSMQGELTEEEATDLDRLKQILPTSSWRLE